MDRLVGKTLVAALGAILFSIVGGGLLGLELVHLAHPVARLAPPGKLGGSPTWLDPLLNKTIEADGGTMPNQPALNFAAPPFIVTNNVANGSTDVTFTQAEGGAGGTTLPDAGAGGIWYQGDAAGPMVASLPAPTGTGTRLLAITGPTSSPFWNLQGSGLNLADPAVLTAPPLVGAGPCSGASPSGCGAWTAINFGSGTSLTNTGTSGVFPSVTLSDFTTGGNETDHLAVVTKAGTTYTVTVAVALTLIMSASTNSGAGIAITDGTKVIKWWIANGNSGGSVAQVAELNSPTSFNSNAFSVNTGIGNQARVCLRIVQNGTTRLYQHAGDCLTYATDFSHAFNTFLTETEYGLVIAPLNSAGSAITLYSFTSTTP